MFSVGVLTARDPEFLHTIMCFLFSDVFSVSPQFIFNNLYKALVVLACKSVDS